MHISNEEQRPHLREREEQRQIATNALELQCLGGLDALPGGRDLCVNSRMDNIGIECEGVQKS